ncbi:condensin complex subunit 3 isoform X2 [Leptidea sinapis]|uniref:condensin complex subunit 3 isoform X2 n=1 Tax=Leptidea sinapis TaxID=189913 RepID=UPI002131917A|nr:condensin complex subunit 3 isoform X2 [Leptidea sinapis]
MTSLEGEAPQAVIKPNPRNNPVIFKIFHNVQFNIVQHKKYVKEMIKLYKKIEANQFRESFKNALLYLFTFGDTSANVDRVIQFVATFCTSLDDEEEFLMFIFNIVFECQCVSGPSVRYRASQLLAAVLSALGEDASLDDDLCDKLLESQMQRLQDTRGAVRCRAALALQRLQNPMEPDDEVTRAYRFHMSCDPSSSVRRAIVMSIAKCARNVPFVLQRLCDVDEAVRRAAFIHIAAMPVTQLRVKQRILILKVGLTERSPRVRRVVEEILIPSWLSSFQGNIIDLLKAIRLDNANDAKDSQYVAGKLLEPLFKRLQTSELLEWLPTDKNLRLIPAEKLNKETAWYWRHLAEHLQSIDDDETLETILPDLVVLIGYIRAIVESPCPSEDEDPVVFGTRQHILHELGMLLRVYDATDPIGRDALQVLITDTLTGDYGVLSADVIRSFVYALQLAVPDVSRRLDIVCRVLSALRDAPDGEAAPPAPVTPVDTAEIKLKRAQLRVSLNVAMEAQEEAVRDENYALAAECKAKVADIQKKLEELNLQTAPVAPIPIPTMKEVNSDPETLNKCLTILNCALSTPQLKTLTPMLEMMFNELELEMKGNPEVLDNALVTMALYGMLDKEFAKKHKAFFFKNFLDTSREDTVATALRAIIDLLCVHGARLFEEHVDTRLSTAHTSRATGSTLDPDTDQSLSDTAVSLTSTHSTVVELLLKIMDDPCPTYRLIIVEGLCRLLYLGHVESPSVLSRLLLLWFNPATVEEDMLRQTIGVFFQVFPMSVDGAQEQIQKATLPTLRALANAPANSPIAEIDQEAVVKFIVSLTRINHELVDSQGGMAAALCSRLVRGLPTGEAALACRLLALLSPPRDAGLARSLADMLRRLCTKLSDKQSIRNVTRYLGALDAMERASLNKMSDSGMEGERTVPTEDTIGSIGRSMGSLRVSTSNTPQPIARSTQVVINETVEEEVEIDETSPTEATNEQVPAPIGTREQTSDATRQSPEAEINKDISKSDSEDSSGQSPVKKPKVGKAKKKLSLAKSKTAVKNGTKKTRGRKKNEKSNDANSEKRNKRTRADQSLDESNTGISSGECLETEKASNRSSRSSANTSTSDNMDKSADETELHTIVYDSDIRQSLLVDSEDESSRRVSRTNVTVPETPDGSEESDS